MADRGNYVDIFFRNGLKEFEVLPPPNVWENIQPALRKRQKSLNILRFAAVVAMVLSLSVSSLWLTRKLSKEFSGQTISLNQEVFPVGVYKERIRQMPANSIEPLVTYSGITVPVVIEEKTSYSQTYLKIPPAGILSASLREGSLQKSIVPVITADNIFGNSRSLGIENLYLASGNSVTKNSKNEVNRWTLSAKASPNYYSSLNFNRNDPSKDLVNNEKSVVSYSGGMAFSYTLNSRVSIQSGLYYSSVGQEITGVTSFSGFSDYYDAKSGSAFSVQTSSGMIVTTNNNIFLHDNISSRVMTNYTIDSFDPSKADLTYVNKSVTQNFNYLEIPVLFKYKAIDRKIDLNFVGGISYNMLVGNSAYAYQSGVKYSIGKTEGLSPVNFSSSLGLGFEYNLSAKVSLDIEPTFRYYLTPLSGLVGSSIHPYSFGIFSGLSYKF
jgi:hypothetical protein